MNWFKIDSWSGTHCFGSFFLAHLIMLTGCERIIAVAVAFACGVLWECDDQFFGKRLGWTFFDIRGWDGTDLAMDLLGCIAALWI